jgi:hypothetical protein
MHARTQGGAAALIVVTLLASRSLELGLSRAVRAADADGDGISDDVDNCPAQRNRGQRDRDGDGVSDKCDSCPTVPNPDQDPTACDCPCFSQEQLDALPDPPTSCALNEGDVFCHAYVLRTTYMLHFDDGNLSPSSSIVGPVRYIPTNDQGRLDPKDSSRAHVRRQSPAKMLRSNVVRVQSPHMVSYPPTMSGRDVDSTP